MDYRDFDLVQQQCENQHATNPRDFMGMAAAYENAQLKAFNVDFDMTDQSDIYSDILQWGYMVDDRNVVGWRRVPVQVGNDVKVDAYLITQHMETLAQLMVDGDLSPTEMYTEFENIHPFIDGNGRVGHILWAWYTVYHGGPWPKTLPPDVFNQGIEGSAPYSGLDPDGNAPPEDEQ